MPRLLHAQRARNVRGMQTAYHGTRHAQHGMRTSNARSMHRMPAACTQDVHAGGIGPIPLVISPNPSFSPAPVVGFMEPEWTTLTFLGGTLPYMYTGIRYRANIRSSTVSGLTLLSFLQCLPGRTAAPLQRSWQGSLGTAAPFAQQYIGEHLLFV